jgi:phosphoglycerate dehydrogenase-like enzyme
VQVDKVVISDLLSRAVVDALRRALLDRGVPSVERYQPGSTPGDGARLAFVGPLLPEELRAPGAGLVWMHSSNAGVDALLRADWPEPVLLTRTVGRMGERIAQFVLGWILAECQKVPLHLEQQQKARWHRLPSELVSGQLAVVYGTGAIGAEIGALLRRNGIRVVGVARGARQVDGFDEVLSPAAAEARLPQARWVVNALPLTASTAGLFDDAVFSRMTGATFINIGRGGTVRLDALERAISSDRVCNAVLDVLTEEPPAADAACWALPRTTITSHSAGITHDEDIVNDFTECWDELRRGALPLLVVRPERGY